MRNLLEGLALIPVAAVAAALIYLPFFIRIMRKGERFFLRHLVNYAFVGCAVMLAAITLSGVFFTGYGDGMRYFNLMPFSEFVRPYMLDEGMYLSQTMLNILMFVPLGFLLPLVFPRRMGRLWSAALAVLAVTALIETAQYFIGRAADIDDVIANFIGGVSGYALYVLLSDFFRGRKWFERLMPSYVKRSLGAVFASVLCLLAVFLLPACLDAANERSEYGIMREVTATVPRSAAINAGISADVPRSVTVYTDETADAMALAKSLAATFCPGVQLSYSEMWNEYYGDNASAVSADDEIRIHTTEKGGSWTVYMPSGAAEGMTDADFSSYARGVAELFLREGETLDAQPLEKTDSLRTAAFDFSGAAGSYTSGSIAVIQRGGEVTVSANLIRSAPKETVAVISAREALSAARGPAANNIGLTDIVIDAVELTYIERKGMRIPAWKFSGEATFLDGMKYGFVSTVDAIKR